MDDALFYAGLILSKTPAWAYLVLVALCVLGGRRLTSRPASPVGLAIVPAIFLFWSVVGTFAFVSVSGVLTALCIWVSSLAAGLFSFRVIGPPRGEWIDRHQFLRAGSWGPLLVYVSIFIFRYGLEIWAGFSPVRALTANATAVILSGYMAGRSVGDLWQAMRLRPPAANVG
jgi:hypothetical protein